MSECVHTGKRRYAIRRRNNGSVHFCVQCMDCLDLIKLPEYDNRPYIRVDEIPPHEQIYPFIERES